MEIEKWSDIAPSFIKAPITAYKYRFVIQKWWKKFLAYTNKGDTNIVVVGRPSVGKSVMLSYLFGETNDLSWKLPEASNEVETTALTLGNWTKIVRVIPGQNVQERYRGLNEAFTTNNNLEGIIYVTDWGFTDVRDRTKKKLMIEDDKITSIRKLRNVHLAQELDDFKFVCKEIERAFALGKAPKWLLIIVNKADLFFDEKSLNTAQAYYHLSGDSKFSEILKDTMNKIGKQRLKCQAIPLCSYEKKLEWNKKLVKTSIGGEENRKSLVMNFFKVIANF